MTPVAKRGNASIVAREVVVRNWIGESIDLFAVRVSVFARLLD
jgi:hypothetical protein